MIWINIKKEYKLRNTKQEAFDRLDELISAPFEDSRFTLFGNFVSTDPTQFLLMPKGWSLGKPMFPENGRTKLLITILEEGDTSRLVATSKTNPSLTIAFICVIATGLLNGLINKFHGSVREFLLYMLILVILVTIDRLVKRMMFSGLERDLKIKTV